MVRMKSHVLELKKVIWRGVVLTVAVVGLSRCSTTHIDSKGDGLPVVPDYVQVPHPAGFEQADLNAIFYSPKAPKDATTSFAEHCDDEFRKLLKETKSKDEIQHGADELVRYDAERTHWCFYAKIAKLQDYLHTDSYWSQRQKVVLDAFEYLNPIANAFLSQYHDTRYLTWAAQYYRRIAEWVFYRHVDPTPDSTLQYVLAQRNNKDPWIQQPSPLQAQAENSSSVFSKYGITMAPTIAGGRAPVDPPVEMSPTNIAPVRAPASAQKTNTTDSPVPASPELPSPAPQSNIPPPPAPVEPAPIPAAAPVPVAPVPAPPIPVAPPAPVIAPADPAPQPPMPVAPPPVPVTNTAPTSANFSGTPISTTQVEQPVNAAPTTIEFQPTTRAIEMPPMPTTPVVMQKTTVALPVPPPMPAPPKQSASSQVSPWAQPGVPTFLPPAGLTTSPH